MIYINQILVHVEANNFVLPTTFHLNEYTKMICYDAFYQVKKGDIYRLYVPETLKSINSFKLEGLASIYFLGNINQWNQIKWYEKPKKEPYVIYDKKISVDHLTVTMDKTEMYSHKSGDFHPIVSVIDEYGEVVNASCYQVSKEKSAIIKQKGTHYVKVQMQGAYEGEVLLPFETKVVKPTNAFIYLDGGHDDIKLTWSAADDAIEYHIYMQKMDESVKKYQKKTTGTSFTKKDLADEKKYRFTIVPCVYNEQGEIVEVTNGSIYADIKTFKKASKPIVKARKDGKVQVSYDYLNAKYDGYQISRTTSSKEKKVVNTKIGRSAYHNYKATKNKTYYFRVRYFQTINGIRVYSPWSDAVKYIKK